MTGRRLSRFVLFVLEIPRLAAVAALLSAFGTRQGWSGTLDSALAGPQVLFVFMAFFSWYDEGRYGAFRVLFAAGKAVSALALAAGFFGALPGLAESVSINSAEGVLAAGAAIPVLVYDLASAVLVGYACFKEYVGSESAAAAPESPEFAVEDLPETKGED